MWPQSIPLSCQCLPGEPLSPLPPEPGGTDQVWSAPNSLSMGVKGPWEGQHREWGAQQFRKVKEVQEDVGCAAGGISCRAPAVSRLKSSGRSAGLGAGP